MNKESVIFYLSQYEAIKTLNNEQLGRLFRALFEKQLQNNSKTTEKEVVLEDDIKIAFNFINNQMVIDENKYKKRCEINRNNGKKGGAPKGNKNALKQPKQPNGVKNNLNDNENDNDNDNEYENENDNESENILVSLMESNGFKLYPIDYEIISTWEDNDLTRYAIKQAVLNQKFSTKYVDRILASYKSKGITTVTLAMKDDEDFKKSKEQKYESKKTAKQVLEEYRKKEREEMLYDKT